MAYEYNAESSQSILTQVAFKEAASYAAVHGWDLLTEGGQSDFEEVFGFLQASLRDSEKRAVASVKKAPAPRSATLPSSAAAVANLKKEFGGGQEQSSLRIITDESEEQGPHPDWLFEVAAERGIRAVKDQRTWASQPSKSGKPRPPYVIAPDLPQGVSDAVKREAWNKAKGLYAPEAA